MVSILLFVFRAIVVLSLGLFVVGLFKPEWISFRGKQWDRFSITVTALVLFVLGFTGIGEMRNYESNPRNDFDAHTISETTYKVDATTPRCAPGSKPGRPGATDDEEAPHGGIEYNVRAPANYDGTIAHPLLMVYAPATRSASASEEFTYLTRQATEAGFIVAYSDHESLAPETIIQQSEIPGLIGQKWCVDKDRIFLTGHSDGGSISMGIAFINGTRDIPAAIAPSAVGITGNDLLDRSCPDPIPVMVMHSANDSHFPGYGKQAVQWWAACNACDRKNVRTLENGCVAYGDCANNVNTWYCEGTGQHPEWPGLNWVVIDFFKAAAGRKS